MPDNHISIIYPVKEDGISRHIARIISCIARILAMVTALLIVLIIALASTGHEEASETVSALIFYSLTSVIILYLVQDILSWFKKEERKTWMED